VLTIKPRLSQDMRTHVSGKRNKKERRGILKPA